MENPESKSRGCRSILIDLKEDQNIRDWMIQQTNRIITRRYKAVHVAEDLGVYPSKIHRFLKGENVNNEFYDKWFEWYCKNR